MSIEKSMLIKKINLIKNCGIFKDFRWNLDDEFKKINVIYGANGAGKTSLAQMFSVASSDSSGEINFLLTVVKEGEEPRQIAKGPLKNIMVFSDSFIEKTHRFDADDPDLDSILTLGEQTIETKEKLKETEETLSDYQTKLAATEEKIKREKEKIESIAKTVGDLVSATLGHLPDYSGRLYHAGKVKGKYKDTRPGWSTQTDDYLEILKETVKSTNKNLLSKTEFVGSIADFQEGVALLLGSSPVSRLLDSLESNPDATDWVDKGRALHENSETCIFCGGNLTSDRREAIKAHFNKEFSELQEKIDSVMNEIKQVTSECGNAKNALPDKGLLFDTFQEDYASAKETYSSALDETIKWLTALLALLKKKRSNVLAEIADSVPKKPEIDNVSLIKIITQHNDLVNDFGNKVKESAELIEQHHLKTKESEYDVGMEALKEQEALKTKLEEDIKKSKSGIASLKNVAGDPLPSAETLTEEVALLLGRKELKFTLGEDGKTYRVLRSGISPATGLSKGERTAIALVHFLEAVNQREHPPIVVIDDPVSSLDSNIFMGASTRIWTLATSKKISQLFLLTHNFELFRQWDIQLDRLTNVLKEEHPHMLMELKTSHKDGNRVPTLSKWPSKNRDKIRSSYHHSFIMLNEVYKKLTDNNSLDHRMDAQLLFPNVIRRVLETFMAFKDPHSVGSFDRTMRAADLLLENGDFSGDVRSIRGSLTRFTNAYSHAETPETDKVINPDELLPILRAVFTFMHYADKEHFEGLCKVTNVEVADFI